MRPQIPILKLELATQQEPPNKFSISQQPYTCPSSVSPTFYNDSYETFHLVISSYAGYYMSANGKTVYNETAFSLVFDPYPCVHG